MKKIRIAQIGTGHPHAAGIMKTVREMTDVFEMVGVWEPQSEFAGNLIKNPVYKNINEMDMDELLERTDVDAVCIETTENVSCQYAKIVLAKGIPVFMDKPGGENAAEFEETVSFAREKNIPFHMGYMYRHNPAVQKCIELCEKGELGKIFSVETDMSINVGGEEIGKYPGGMIYFLGCHLIDIVFRLLGRPCAIENMSFSTHIDGHDSLDAGVVLYKYDGAVAIAKTYANAVNGFCGRRLTVCGSKGSAELLPIESFTEKGLVSTSLKVTLKKDNPSSCFDCSKTYKFAEFDRYEFMMKSFAEDILKIKNNEYSYDYEINLHKLILESCRLQ